MKTVLASIIVALCVGILPGVAQYTNTPVCAWTDAQSSPTIALHPTNPNIQMATFVSYDGSDIYPGYGFSTDRGVTWSNGEIPYPKFPPSGYTNGVLDPSCVINRSGRYFYCYGAENASRWDVFVSYTDDKSTWSTPGCLSLTEPHSLP